MHSYRVSLWSVLAATILLLTACGAPPPPKPPDPVQNEFDRFVGLIVDGMWRNGAVTGISAKPNAPDEVLIAASVQQLNNIPGPIKQWHILKKEHVGPTEFNAYLRKKYPKMFSQQWLIPTPHVFSDLPLMPYKFYKWFTQGAPISVSTGLNAGETDKFLIAILDSDQGHKIVAIDEYQFPNGGHWARMYNCDAVFTSPMNGFQGTPLIR